MVIRRWLGKCEAWDTTYGAERCKLRHGHDGDHHFGILRTPYLTLDLDAPVTVSYTLPPPFASPPPSPPGPGGVDTTRHCCCHCRCKEAP